MDVVGLAGDLQVEAEVRKWQAVRPMGGPESGSGGLVELALAAIV